MKSVVGQNCVCNKSGVSGVEIRSERHQYSIGFTCQSLTGLYSIAMPISKLTTSQTVKQKPEIVFNIKYEQTIRAYLNKSTEHYTR